MNPPDEFASSWVAAHSAEEEQPYRAFLKNREPFATLYADHPELAPPDLKAPLPWSTGQYWDTTVAKKHPYWSDIDLPQATKDIRLLRRDLATWGYCLIEDGLSKTQCDRFRERLLEQAAGERAAGIAMMAPSGQYVHTLINKGACFVGCIEQNPEAVQAGPVIEQLMDETLGKGWICHSFLANGADPGGYPQGLHMDQGPLLPWVTVEAPALVNTMFIPQDVNEDNGGTLVIPGSHQRIAAAGSGGKLGELPPAINLEARAGTIMVFDGRLLHGTGANRTDHPRYVATMSNVKSWMRTQENWVISVAPDVLEDASPTLQHRLGLQAVTYGATIEGFGISAGGRAADPWSSIKPFRSAYDAGTYERVRELSPDSPPEVLAKPYTVRKAIADAREMRRKTGAPR